MGQLKLYHESVLRPKGWPAFHELSKDQKTLIKRTYGFAIFQFQQAVKELFTQVMISLRLEELVKKVLKRLR